MRVEIRLSPEISEPYAIVYAAGLTQEVQRAAALLESAESVITAMDEGRIVVLRPEDVFLIRVENGQTMICLSDAQYRSTKRLYELEAQLGHPFLRISKSSLVNVKKIQSVEPSFHGVMQLLMKNGTWDYVSRRYLPALKKYLGL